MHQLVSSDEDEKKERKRKKKNKTKTKVKVISDITHQNIYLIETAASYHVDLRPATFVVKVCFCFLSTLYLTSLCLVCS